MRQFINANYRVLDNDRQDRMYAGGIVVLRTMSLPRHARLDGSRPVATPAAGLGLKRHAKPGRPAQSVTSQPLTATGPRRCWRPEQPSRLLAFARTG